MTPELREAIRLLRMSRLELIKAIRDDLEALDVRSELPQSDPERP